jgi:hypothetical protein
MPAITTLPDISAPIGVPYGLFDVLGGAYSATLSGDLTLTTDHPVVTKLDPGGAGRTITLEAESGAAGRFRLVVNSADAAEVLTINNDAAAAISTPAQNEAALLYCDGTSWTEIAVFTISFTP